MNKFKSVFLGSIILSIPSLIQAATPSLTAVPADSNTSKTSALTLNYDWQKYPRLHWGFNDLNSDGKADTLALRWNNKTVVYVADDGQLPWGKELEKQDWNAYFNTAFNVGVEPPNMWNPVRGTWGNYTILVDRNDNARFDDKDDFYYKTLDLNHDGAPEAEFYNLFPEIEPWSNKLVVNLDGARDMSYLDWQNFCYGDEQRYLPGFKYIMNVHGSGFFLLGYSKYVQNACETPIAWYDFDFDGRTNMVMRAQSPEILTSDTLDSRIYLDYLNNFEIAFELNGNTSPARYHSLDMQLTYYGGKGPDYSQYAEKFPLLRGLPQAAFLSENLLFLRQETVRRYFPYMDGYKIGTDFNSYDGVWMFFDEEEDDCRWEEMFNIHETGWAGFADQIGDRCEQDPNFAGKGKLYISPMDGKIHLYQAKQGWWEIDYLGLYHGSQDRVNTVEGPKPPAGLRYPQVRYYDTNHNGFIDRIEYCTVQYGDEENTRVVQKTVDLLAYATPDNPAPDVGVVFDPRIDVPLTGWMVDKWDGQPLDANDFKGTPCKVGFDKMYAYYGTVCDAMWSDAVKLYEVARKHKLNKSEILDANSKTSYTRDELAAMKEYKVPEGYSKHVNAASRRDKYNNGYWLKEKVFADILKYSGGDPNTLQRLYYTGKIDQLVAEVEKSPKNTKDIMVSPCNAANMLPNGGFEDSPTQVLQWDVFNSSDTFHADMVSDAAKVVEGKNAVRLYKTSTADGALHKDSHMLPWQGYHILKLVFSVKDDPTLAAGEYVQSIVSSSDSASLSGLNGFVSVARHPAKTDTYSTYTEIIRGIPESTKFITMNLRITDACGISIAGDLLVDDIQLYDMGEPVLLPSPLRLGYNDLNADGKPDTLAFRWNSKTVVYVADDGQLPWGKELEKQDWHAYFNKAFNVGVDPPNMWNPMRGTWGNYTILVDRNDNARFDDNADFYYKTLDLNRDGAPEAEYYHLFPGHIDWSNKLVVNLDGERDMSYLDWQSFFYPDEQRYLPGIKYIMNVHGSGFFLNSYSKYVKNSIENPIAWYDFDFDGRTNMVMRTADTHIVNMPEGDAYRGDLGEFEVAFELNGNTSPAKYHSLDMQLTYYNYDMAKKGPDYSAYVDKIPLLRGLKEAAFLSEKMLPTRHEILRGYWPYMDGYKLGTDANSYDGVWLFFDEDDDDCRWEEMFNVHESGWAGFADQIGDRCDYDPNFDGKGKLYISPMDGKIHLYRAKQAWWEIDYSSMYRGSQDRVKYGTAEGPKPPAGLRYPQLRYYDTDKNGFIDRIEYCTVQYGNEENTMVVQKTVDLLKYATTENLHPDVALLFDPRIDVPLTGWMVEKWDGQPLDANDFKGTPCKVGFDKMYAYYGTVCDAMWSDAAKLYDVARKHKLNKSENLDADIKTSYTLEELAALKEYKVPDGYSRHTKAASRRDKYHNGYWLKEKVFADIIKYSGLDPNTLQRLYYTDKIDQVVAEVEKSKKTNKSVE